MSRFKKSFFYLFMVLIVVLLIEGFGWFVLESIPDIKNTRNYLRGDSVEKVSVNSVAQPYLLYISAPNYVSVEGVQQHNEDGYRGEKIPLKRSPNTFRVLFLGGSTTYGEGVANPQASYPAVMGQLIQQDPAFSSKKVEIINAGLRFGTTAEILTHYLLKFRYYKPDAIVINPGGNDPVAYVTPSYQPDYSHWRKQMIRLQPLPAHAAWVLNSDFLSALSIILFYSDAAFGNGVAHRDEITPAKWFEAEHEGKLQLEEVAFYNNMKTVVSEMQRDGASVFLISYQGNPFHDFDQMRFRRFYDYEEMLLQRVAQESGANYAPFPLQLMPEKYWVDPSHINEEGEKIKAAYAYEKFAEGLRQALHTSETRVRVEMGSELALPKFK